MRILQVLPYLTKGGAERVVVDLSNSLLKGNHSVTILLAHPVDPRLNQNQIDEKVLVRFVSEKINNAITRYLKLPFWIIRNWKNLNSYDVIHCHLTYGLIFGLITSLSRKRKFRVVGTCHSVAMDIDPLRKIFYRKVSKYFASFILVGQDSEWEKFIARKINSNIKIIPNGLDCAAIQPTSKDSEGEKLFVVGTISRLELERKPALFLEVFNHINTLIPDRCRFILAGSGSQYNSLINFAKDLGISQKISMPGLILDANAVFKEIDVYVSLNMDENTGIAGLEAVLAGKPVIGIQLSPTYLLRESDLTWSDQDPSRIADQVVKYLQNPSVANGVKTRQFKQVCTDYSVERMRDDYLQVYRASK
jgi:glycosyltransferase involved in cell wall biosynthesis